MALTYAFQPAYGTGGSVATGAASAEQALSTGQNSIKIKNTDATNGAFVRIGKSGVTATTADLWLSPGDSVVLTKGQDDDSMAYLQSVGAVTLRYILGEGKA